MAALATAADPAAADDDLMCSSGIVLPVDRSCVAVAAAPFCCCCVIIFSCDVVVAGTWVESTRCAFGLDRSSASAVPG